jgi:hypothetical protein
MIAEIYAAELSLPDKNYVLPVFFALHERKPAFTLICPPKNTAAA